MENEIAEPKKGESEQMRLNRLMQRKTIPERLAHRIKKHHRAYPPQAQAADILAGDSIPCGRNYCLYRINPVVIERPSKLTSRALRRVFLPGTGPNTRLS